ncbi:MAG: hypothetical protein JXB13_12645, partial [Phycisphaerae bacterium]|nr:hypothetical protein [Phycisphaerae bacterium]
RTADPDPAFAAAQVLIVENRLLVLPGTEGQTVLFQCSGADPAAELLRLTSKVAVDVQRGRLAFAIGAEPPHPLRVSYNYGFSANLGGGPYDRRRKPARLGETAPAEPDTVLDPTALGHLIQVPSTDIPTVTEALMRWQNTLLSWSDPGEPRFVIQIEDSRTCESGLTINLSRGELVLQAANEHRPTLLGDITVNVTGEDCRLRLDGLWIAGHVRITGGLDRLQLRHCTLVPGLRLKENGEPMQPEEPSLRVASKNVTLVCELDHVISGPLWLPVDSAGVFIRDSIVDSPCRGGRVRPIPRTVRVPLGPTIPPVLMPGTAHPALAGASGGGALGPPATIERTTFFGRVQVRELTLASEVIFTESVRVERRQVGCVRFSSVAALSQTPRRYHCQPDLALTGVTVAAQQARQRRRLRPTFTSVHYGQPGYAQLGAGCADEIRTGAEDGSEMGAFHELMQPQRFTNLELRMDEYLPCGLVPGHVFVT